MKIAIPSRGDMIDEHFGHCEAFTIVTIEGNSVIERMRLVPPPACGCKSNLVSTLSEMGVSVLLAGSMGEGAARLLGQNGIGTVRGASGTVDDAILAYMAGRLADDGNACRAHEGCGH